VLALALFAVALLRGWKIWLLGGIAALGLILALGDAGYLYGFLRRILPQLGFMRYPVKFVMLTTFAVPLLAACGFENSCAKPAKTAPEVGDFSVCYG